MDLTESEKIRYHRQIIIPGWDEEGQKRLKSAKVGIIGTGGLGSPISIYLAVAGIGKLIIYDKDKVELSNLNRQILHWQRNINKEKALSAGEKLTEINPEIEIICISEEITEKNISKAFEEVDVVVDALDNFHSRFILNEFSVEKKIPFFHGAIWGFEGRATTIIPGETACFRCIYSDSPPAETFPIVGVTSGLIGIIQATEVIKYFTKIGKLLLNELLVYDGARMSFSKIKLQRDLNCPVCKTSSSLT